MLSLFLPSFLLALCHVALSWRLERLTDMYAFEGFVYGLNECPSLPKMLHDFTAMRKIGARNVITFDICGDGMDTSYYGHAIRAAGETGLNIMPLAWTLRVSNNETVDNTSIPRTEAVIRAVIENPDPVIAVAVGDEPLFDDDFGSADNLASYIRKVKTQLANAGLEDIPVSISELAYGWQESGNITAMQEVVDFFMINNFPYFAFDATSGGNFTSWNDFLNDMDYYANISTGKPLIVAQTGWPSNEDQYAPNSPNIVASVLSEKAYWNLLDHHCEDFFKSRNIGWMWRSWDDSVKGWGAVYDNGTEKWDLDARLWC